MSAPREFPRLIYRGDGSREHRLVVKDEAEMAAALAAGWREAKVPDVEAEPKKRGPGRPRKDEA